MMQVYVPGGSAATLAEEANAVHFLNEAWKHCKAIAADASAKVILDETYFAEEVWDAKLNNTQSANGLNCK